VYRARRDALVEALRRHLSGAVHFAIPAGGMALWAHVAPDVDVEAWAAHAIHYGVAFAGGRMYDFHAEAQPAMRLGFSPLDHGELDEAVRRMAAALPSHRRQAPEVARGPRRASRRLAAAPAFVTR
jgi:GntR family transcriptional regulator/MocR family aminotransferase